MKRQLVNRQTNSPIKGTILHARNALGHKRSPVSIIVKKQGSVLQALAREVAVSTEPRNSGKRYGIRPMIIRISGLMAGTRTGFVFFVNKTMPKIPADMCQCKAGDVVEVCRINTDR